MTKFNKQQQDYVGERIQNYKKEEKTKISFSIMFLVIFFTFAPLIAACLMFLQVFYPVGSIIKIPEYVHYIANFFVIISFFSLIVSLICIAYSTRCCQIGLDSLKNNTDVCRQSWINSTIGSTFRKSFIKWLSKMLRRFGSLCLAAALVFSGHIITACFYLFTLLIYYFLKNDNIKIFKEYVCLVVEKENNKEK